MKWERDGGEERKTMNIRKTRKGKWKRRYGTRQKKDGRAVKVMIEEGKKWKDRKKKLKSGKQKKKGASV